MRAHPLDGLRVLELCAGVAGAYCGRHLAMWGADVVVAEPADGPPLRRAAPATGETGASLLHAFLAANKAAVPIGEALGARLAHADVLLTDLSAANLAAQSLDLDEMAAARPDLVIVHLSPWGRAGPYADWPASELTVQAQAGYLALNGMAGRAPLRAPGRLISYAHGAAAFIAALAGVFRRTRSGHGGLAEVSAYETAALITPLLRIEYLGAEQQRDSGPDTGVRILPCADGYVSLMVDDAANAQAYLEVVGVPLHAWPDRDAFATASARFAALAALLSAYTHTRSARSVCSGLLQRGIVCGLMQRPADILADPHLAQREFFLPGEVQGRAVRFAGPAGRFSRSVPRTPELACAGIAPPAWQARPSSPRTADPPAPPLAGVRILDLTQAWLGPFAAMLLADLGAEVTKIETHRRPDVWRQLSIHPVSLQTVWSAAVNTSPNFNSVNRGKRSLCLDLQTEPGRNLFLNLVGRADLVMENFTPRVLDRFGLSYDHLAKVNPRIVVSSFSGFGKTGPLSEFKANGTSIEAFGGWDDLHRYPDGPPLAMGFYQADAFAGLQMAALSLLALIERQSSGQGQSIDASMYEAACGYIGEHLLAAAFDDVNPPPFNLDPDAGAGGVFAAAGADAWMALAISSEAEWRALRACAPPALAGLDMAASGVSEALASWIAAEDAETLAQALRSAGVPAAAVRRPASVLDCPHLADRGFFLRLHHPSVGVHRYPGAPWRIAGSAPAATPPPRLGEHNAQLLAELGLSDADIAALYDAGVTGAIL